MLSLRPDYGGLSVSKQFFVICQILVVSFRCLDFRVARAPSLASKALCKASVMVWYDRSRAFVSLPIQPVGANSQLFLGCNNLVRLELLEHAYLKSLWLDFAIVI